MESLGRELVALKKTFLPYLLGLFGVSLFIFTFGIGRTGLGFYYPYPTVDSISVYMLKVLIDRLIPDTVQVVALSPFNVFLTLLAISFVAGFILTFPFLFYRVVAYLSPALYYSERRALMRVSVSASLLFVGGALFSYFMVIPQTFRLLYMFAGAVGVGELFHISQFVGLVLGLIVAIGLMFQLPIIMVLLSRFGIVDEGFWEKKWRHALVGILILTAFITPDGTGISMAMLSLPMVGLYSAGVVISKKERRLHAQRI